MKKIIKSPRPNWVEACLEDGFYFHSIDGRYWIEDYAFEFTQQEAHILYAAAKELNAMCIDMVDDLIKQGAYEYYQYPIDVCEQIEKSWQRKDFNLYSRFDFSYDGITAPKMMEYNADTPTSVIESSKIQARWLQDCYPQYSQCNELLETLTKRWKQIPYKGLIHLSAHNVSEEDWCNVKVLQECAEKAGLNTRYIDLQEIGWDENKEQFIDLDSQEIKTLFKLHPWEFLIADVFYPQILKSQINLIEPMWKMLLSSKAILPLLWKRHPNHPNLLPAYFNEDEMRHVSEKFVKKPLYSREGANISIYDGEDIVDTQSGFYGAEGFIYQQRKDLICFDNRYSMLGLWLAGDEPCGMGVREDASLITKDTSWFIPHYVK